jgi:NitT/TauT family transport system substrate-binding protein
MNTIPIGYLSTLYHTSHILKRPGWLEASGIDADWRLFGTGPAMVEAFVAGSITLGYIGLPPAMIGIDREVPLRCIAGGHIEGTVMIARAGVPSCQDERAVKAVLEKFRGKKIGSPARGSIHDVIIRSLIKKYDIAGAEVINFPWADLIPAAIDEGEIDGAVGTPQLAVVAERYYGQQIIIAPRCLWQFNPSYGIVVHEKMLHEKQLLQDFLHLHEQACNVMREQPKQTAQFVAEGSRAVDADFITKTYAISPRYCSALPDEYITSTLAFVPELIALGYLKQALTKEQIFDLSCIQNVHLDPHHY